MNDALAIPNLSQQELRELKNRLHQMKPAVVIGTNGLDEVTLQSIDNALDSCELIKVRTHLSSSEDLSKIAREICTKTRAILIQTIGSIIAIYRPNSQVEN